MISWPARSTDTSGLISARPTCAVLWAQLERSYEITGARLANFRTYSEGLTGLAKRGAFQIPNIPSDCENNAHIFFLVLASKNLKIFFEKELKKKGISAYSHYVPLHSAPAGRKYGRVGSDMSVTDAVFDGLLRLPVWTGLRIDEIQYVVQSVEQIWSLAEINGVK